MFVDFILVWLSHYFDLSINNSSYEEETRVWRIKSKALVTIEAHTVTYYCLHSPYFVSGEYLSH